MILVTGGSGQVATELLQRAPLLPQETMRHVGRPEFDFDHPETIDAVFHDVKPTLVVNAAAWTAVDAAEANEAAALRANAEGPGRLAQLCATAGVPLVHISTDYVFDGAKGAPYVETDATSPTGVYGSSKLAGEHAVLAAGGQAVILRTSWVYAAMGKNFVRTMLGAALKTNNLRVVADQQGCPTNAGDLANAILGVVARIREGWRPEYAGIFNAAGTGSTTWHGLAVAAFEEAARHGRAMPTVTPIATADWPTPARRPADSRLDCSKLAAVFGVRLPEWRPTLASTVDTIIAAG
jgi:dTDP-4-dehydrorhamnose reductase